jgi:predicted metal-dependent peptidase
MADVWKTPEERITRALADLQKAQPFFAHLAMGLKPERQDAVITAGVDAKGRMYYNGDFVMGLSIDELMGVLCHEVLHVALIHMQRIESRNHKISNIAQDCVVNYAVIQSGLKLPDVGIQIERYSNSAKIPMPDKSIRVKDVDKKSWEDIYDEIFPQFPNPPPNASGGSGSGEGDQPGNQAGNQDRPWGFDEHIRGEISEQEQKDAENEWKSRMCEAANYAKQQGHLPAGMDRMLDGILKPKVMWKALLLRYLKAHFTPVDWSYSRPHKKSQALGVFLPNTLKENVECEIYVDTSGSVSNKELSEFLTEIVAIAKSMSHIKMWVTFIDAQITEESRYCVENGEISKILAMKPKGGGGTDMEVGLDYCKKHNPTIPVTVVFTDGYVPINRSAKDYPFDIIWVVTPNGTTKNLTYGHVVQMD